MSRRTYALTAAVAAAIAVPATIALADGDHGSMPMGGSHMAPKTMTVKAKLTKDPMKGYNLQLTTKGFRWAPQRASMKARSGEGHAHLFIDGTKITRLYGPWYYLGDLKPGKHTIRVSLNGNDHGDYMRSGKAIEATVKVTVPAM